MNPTLRIRISRALLACGIALPFLLSAPVHGAEDGAKYPSKAIRFIVPFAPGGGHDTIARLVGQQMAITFGQQVTIDNRPGAAGALGAQLAATSPADGYTIFLAGVGSHGLNPNLTKKPLYDPVRDFDAISLIASAPLLVVVHPSLPVKSVKDLIALAKAKPGVINYASNGTGGSSHMAVELFDMMAGTRMTHIPYKGLAPALTELMSGEVQVMFSSAVAMLPQVKAGRLRAIAMTGLQRSQSLPEVPTLDETVLKGFNADTWVGLFAPARTPEPIVRRLSDVTKAALADPDVRRKLVAGGNNIVGNDTAAFRLFLDAESKKWGEVVRAGNIKLDE